MEREALHPLSIWEENMTVSSHSNLELILSANNENDDHSLMSVLVSQRGGEIDKTFAVLFTEIEVIKPKG